MRILLVIALIFGTFSAQAKIHFEEMDYKASTIKYYHSGSRVKIKINNLPYGTAEVTVSPVNSSKKPKLFIIGKRRFKVGNDDAIEFTVELEDLKPGTYNTKSSEISLTLYSYINETKLEIDEKAKLFIRPIICSDEGDGVCALMDKDCHKGQQNCEDHVEKKTFRNLCDMKKHEATFLHTGECVADE